MQQGKDQLCLDQNLINPKFNAYKLIFTESQVQHLLFDKQVLEIYSPLSNSDLLSNKMNLFLNFLYHHNDLLYYFSLSGNLIELSEQNKQCTERIVFTIDISQSLFSPSIRFLDQNLCFIFDGNDSFFLIDILHNWNIIGKFCNAFGNNSQKLLLTASLFEDRVKLAVACVIDANKENIKKSLCVRVFALDPKFKTCFSTKDYEFYDYPYLFRFIGHEHFFAVVDSRYKIFLSNEKIDEPNKSFYSWSQDDESVSIKFQMNAFGIDDSHQICIKFDRLLIGNYDLLLSHVINNEASRWTINKDLVEIVLVKKETVFWKYLFQNDIGGTHEISNSEREHDENICLSLDRFTSDEILNKVTETADIYDESFTDESQDGADYLLGMWNELDSKPIREINLITQKILCSSHDGTPNPSIFCIKRDVDGLVFDVTSENGINMVCKHTHSFHAMSYILSSKTDTRFTFISDDYRFFVVIDTRGYVFVYECSNQQNEGRQQVFHITGLPIGAVFNHHTLYILTKEQLFKINVF